MKLKVIPKQQRIAIYKEAIRCIHLNKHCESGLCSLFDCIAEDLGYVPKSYNLSNYYQLSLYPEMPRDYRNASTGGFYHGADIGFATKKGKEKRLNLLKQIVNKIEHEKINKKNSKVSKD